MAKPAGTWRMVRPYHFRLQDGFARLSFLNSSKLATPTTDKVHSPAYKASYRSSSFVLGTETALGQFCSTKTALAVVSQTQIGKLAAMASSMLLMSVLEYSQRRRNSPSWRYVEETSSAHSHIDAANIREAGVLGQGSRNLVRERTVSITRPHIHYIYLGASLVSTRITNKLQEKVDNTRGSDSKHN